METDKHNHIRGFHAATISVSIRQSKGKYEWNTKKADPLQISQQHLNQPIEHDTQNHRRGCQAATISESIRQRKGKYA